MDTIHQAFDLLEDGHPRVHNIITQGAPVFPTEHYVFGPTSGVAQKILLHSQAGVTEFSCTIALTLESWSERENTENARVETVCIWRMQILPNDPEIRNAIDMKPDNKDAIMDEVKRALNMLQHVPLIRGSAFILRFGHRGEEYPYIEILPMFYFGQCMIIEEVNKQIEAYQRKQRNPFNLLLWAGYWIFYKVCSQLLSVDIDPPPQKPTVVGDPPDLWVGNDHIAIVASRFETILSSLIRRIELRFAQRMMEVGVKPAPGDSDTVAFVNSRVSEGISRRRLKRDGAVTVFRPGMDDYDGISIPVARAPTPRTSAPAGLGKAAANVAPPPPPKGIGIVVSPSATRDVDQPEIPTVMERGDKFIVKATQPVRTRKLTPQRPTAGKRIGADDNKSMYLEDED